MIAPSRVLYSVWSRRFALRNLVLKDFRIRYRNMSLGILWSVLNPLVMVSVLAFIFTFIFPSGRQDFPIFLLIGLVTFNFFSLCLSAATGSIVDNAALVRKTIFPREILPVSVVLSQLIHVLIQMALLGLFVILFAVPVRPSYLWLPLIYLVELTAVIGAAFACSALNVYYRDVRYLVESSFTILFWLSPVFYPLELVREKLPDAVYAAYCLNPIAGCIDGARHAVLEGSAPDPFAFGTTIASATALFLGGTWLFARLERDFADHV